MKIYPFFFFTTKIPLSIFFITILSPSTFSEEKEKEKSMNYFIPLAQIGRVGLQFSMETAHQNRGVLQRMCKKTLPTVSPDPTKPVSSGRIIMTIRNKINFMTKFSILLGRIFYKIKRTSLLLKNCTHPIIYLHMYF